jgi:hypothetical protein
VSLPGLVQNYKGSTQAAIRYGTQELVVTKFREIDGYDIAISLRYLVGVRGAVETLDDVIDVARLLPRRPSALELVKKFGFLHASEFSLAVEAGNGIRYQWSSVLSQSEEWSIHLLRLLREHPTFGEMLPGMSHGSIRLIENGLSGDVPNRFQATILEGPGGEYRGYVSHGQSELELWFSAPNPDRVVQELEQRLTVP